MDENVKKLLVVVIAIGVLVIAYALFYGKGFVTGEEVDKDTFAGILADAEKIHIVMDLRGIEDNKTRWGVMQCGVDFAGSWGLADKDTDYFSFDLEESLAKEQYCIHSKDSRIPIDECFDRINADGVTLYIKSGTGTKYYENGMVVGVGSNYELDQCSIGIR